MSSEKIEFEDGHIEYEKPSLIPLMKLRGEVVRKARENAKDKDGGLTDDEILASVIESCSSVVKIKHKKIKKYEDLLNHEPAIEALLQLGEVVSTWLNYDKKKEIG